MGSVNPNDYSPNQIQYRNDLATGVTTLTGTNLGNDFRIVGNDGTTWTANVDSDTITAYNGSGHGGKLHHQ